MTVHHTAGANSHLDRSVHEVRRHASGQPQMPASGVIASIIHPLLAAIGWDVQDPDRTQHLDDHAIMLKVNQSTACKVVVLALARPIPADFAQSIPGTVPLKLVTNGVDWRLHSKVHPSCPERSACLFAPDFQAFWERLSPASVADIASGSAVSQDELDAKMSRALLDHIISSTDIIAKLRRHIAIDPAHVSDEELLRALGRIVTRASEDDLRRANASTLNASVRSKSAHGGDWPADATHVLRRKGVAAFLSYRRKTGSSLLLAGSVISDKTGRSLYKSQVEARLAAERSQQIGHVNGSLRVLSAIPFQNPKQAASFACGALIKDPSVWKTKGGTSLKLCR